MCFHSFVSVGLVFALCLYTLLRHLCFVCVAFLLQCFVVVSVLFVVFLCVLRFPSVAVHGLFYRGLVLVLCLGFRSH